jgi:hypothetical protein
VANLPPVSTTPAELVAKFAAGVIDTGGKFAAGVVDTGGSFAAGVVDIGGKFATVVMLIPEAHLELQISPQIFKQIRHDPSIIFR